MRFVFLFLLLVLGATNIQAQQRSEPLPGIPPDSTPQASSHPSATSHSGTTNPAAARAPQRAVDIERGVFLTAIPNACVRPGDMITIEGRNLRALDRKVPALEVEGDFIVLDILNKTDRRFVVRAPLDGVTPGKTYPLALVKVSSLRRFQNTGLSIRICSLMSANSDSIRSELEILIFAEILQKAAIMLELGNRGVNVLEDIDLDALGSFMIRASSADAVRMIDELRIALPDAEIDLNGALSTVSGPRLYLKEKIVWPKKSDCAAGASAPSIGLIDGRIDQDHPAFSGRKIISKDFLRGQFPDEGHATAIASILIGNAPELGLEGLLPGARLYSAVVLRQASDNQEVASVRAIVEGLNWLLLQRLRLVNISLVTDRRNSVLIAAIEKSLARGALIFTAAGNQGPQALISYPAAIDGVIAVTAVDAVDRIYDAANQGDYVDFSAPGVDIWAALPGGSGAYVSGTSFAAPVAVAVAALIQRKNPSISVQVILHALSAKSRDLGRTGKDRVFGNGLLQSYC